MRRELRMKVEKMSPFFRGVGVKAAIAAAALTLAGASGNAQQKSADLPLALPFEALPPQIEKLVEEFDKAALPGEPSENLQGIYQRLKRWEAGSTLKVCFFGGDVLLRARVAMVASEWAQHGNLAFDFGPKAVPRICDDNGPYHIRIGFRYRGVWSLVGLESLVMRQDVPSMNFWKFDVAKPREPEFSRQVLHEFGHALGFHHEHQNFEGVCESELDWERLSADLAIDPGWPPAKVKKNMARLLDDGRYEVVGGFDVRSIMMYPLKASWFKANAAAGSCYIARASYSISADDKAMMAQAYPSDAERALVEREAALGELLAGIRSSSPNARTGDRGVATTKMLFKPATNARRIIDRLPWGPG